MSLSLASLHHSENVKTGRREQQGWLELGLGLGLSEGALIF